MQWSAENSTTNNILNFCVYYNARKTLEKGDKFHVKSHKQQRCTGLG